MRHGVRACATRARSPIGSRRARHATTAFGTTQCAGATCQCEGSPRASDCAPLGAASVGVVHLASRIERLVAQCAAKITIVLQRACEQAERIEGIREWPDATKIERAEARLVADDAAERRGPR